MRCHFKSVLVKCFTFGEIREDHEFAILAEYRLGRPTCCRIYSPECPYLTFLWNIRCFGTLCCLHRRQAAPSCRWGGYVMERYLSNGTFFPIPQEENPHDPNLFLGANSSVPSHSQEFVNPILDVVYILNLGAKLTSNLKMASYPSKACSKVDGGPCHMVINKGGTFGWIVRETSCMIQPVKGPEI